MKRRHLWVLLVLGDLLIEGIAAAALPEYKPKVRPSAYTFAALALWMQWCYGEKS